MLMKHVPQNPVSGWQPFAFPRVSPEEGAFWKDVVNLRMHDGVVERRRALFNMEAPPIAQPPLSGLRHEYPLYLWMRTNPTLLDAVTLDVVLVTTVEAYHYVDGVWTIITPIYNTGTVSWNSASTTVTGVGTLWLTRFISPGNFILLGSDLRLITAVNSDTDITIATTPSTTAAGQPYTIRRTFGQTQTTLTSGEGYNQRNHLYARIFNGELYVASSFMAGDVGGPAIAKTFLISSPSPLSYLSAENDLTGALDNWGAVVTSIDGLAVLADGRAVVSTSTGTGNLAELRYSDPANQLTWTTSPGGTVNDVSGGINKPVAIQSFGNAFALCYPDGFSLARLTGQRVDPLAFEPTREQTIGPWFYRTIKIVGGLLYFVGPDLNIYYFDGTRSVKVGDTHRNIVRSRGEALSTTWNVHANVDLTRNEYQVWFPEDWLDATSTASTDCFCLDLGTGEMRHESHGARISVVMDQAYGPPAVVAILGSLLNGHASYTRSYYGQIAGVWSSPGTASAPLVKLVEWRAADDPTVQLYDAADADPPALISHPIDWGRPGAQDLVVRIKVYAKRDPIMTTLSDTLKIGISRDGGSTYTERDLSFTLTVGGTEAEATAFFDGISGVEAGVVRIRSAQANLGWASQITRIIYHVTEQGQTEGVA